MFLLPYVKLPNRAEGFQQVWLFLERNGTHLIEIDVADVSGGIQYATEFLELNGFTTVADIFYDNGIVFCPIDPACSALAECYTWKETPSGTTPVREVWRTFLWISAADKPDPWGVNSAMSEISLSDTHTAYSVLKRILDLKD
jgi:hypothetical protein